MKLSDFFRDIATVWNQKTLVGIGFLAFVFGLGVYAGYRLAMKQESHALVYSVFIVVLLIAIAIADINGAFAVLMNPIALATVGIIFGVGWDVLRRLKN